MQKVLGLGTDGAAVMTGRHNGLGAKLVRRNKNIVHIRCVAHRLNLAVSQAGKSIEYCKNYHAMIHSLYQFYRDSSVRYDELRQLQTVLNGKAKQIVEPTSVRWLSIESAVKMVLDSYCAIMLSLDAEKSPKAVGLSKFIGNSLFLLFTALLIDILTAIGILSLTFQKDAVNLSHIKHSVTSAKNTLTDMRKGSSKVTEVLHALGEMPTGEAAKYHDVNVSDNNILRQRFNDIRNTYLDKLSSNLDDRFPSDMVDKLECFDVLFNPGRYPSDLNLLDYGVQQFGVLVEFYQELVNKDRMEASFLQFKHLAKSFQVLSFEAFVKVLITEFNEEFPDFVLLGKIAGASSFLCPM
ncbi:zinc finger protein 862-like [Liolophura sinensis]|uniref:zinc finger protein 862-like n=1 Tax=Liolophura sinensis TaxID=3198878 RepID=UPI0031598638